MEFDAHFLSLVNVYRKYSVLSIESVLHTLVLISSNKLYFLSTIRDENYSNIMLRRVYSQWLTVRAVTSSSSYNFKSSIVSGGFL